MAENEEKMRKMRCRMERDAYSVLLSFKDGANPRSLERRMDETLGYTYHNKYHEGGVHDMEQLLREHKKIKEIGGGKFRIIPVEEVRDLVELIKNQRDRNDEKGGRDKRSRYGNSLRSRRLGTHATFRSGLGGSFGFRQAKGFGGLRPITSEAKHYPDGGSDGFKPLMSVSLSSNSHITSSLSTSTLPNYGMRPIIRPAVTPSSFEPTPIIKPPGSPAKSSKPATPASLIPSPKEFMENSKKMMRTVQGSVHLSEMTDLYAKEFGVIVDPLQVFSKSWKAFVNSTFKEWLEMDSEGQVRLKDSGGRSVRKTSRSASPRTPDFAAIQGFKYQSPRKMQLILDDSDEEPVIIRPTLPTPDKPPGITLQPDLLMTLMRPKSAAANLGQRLREAPQPGEYEKTWFANLRTIKKSDEMKQRIAEALSEHNLKRGTRNSPPGTALRSRHPNSNANQQSVRRVAKPDPYASLPKFGQRIIPQKSTPDIQSIVKPMENLVTPVVEKLPEVKTEGARMTAYYPPSVTVPSRQSSETQLIEQTPEVKNEEPIKAYYPPSVMPTRRPPSKLPPMSKGKGIPSTPRPTSTASSCTRNFNQAVVSALPYDDDWW